MPSKRLALPLLMLWTYTYSVIALTLINFLYILKKCLFIKNGWSHCTTEHFYTTRQKFIRNSQQQQQQQQQKLQIQHKPIPVVKGLPLFGTFFDIIAAGAYPELHNYIDNRHKQYGRIFRERLGGSHDAVFVSSANLMRAVFMNEGQHPKHPLPDAWILYNKKHNCQRGLFFMEGEEWYHNRRILSRCLLNGNLDWMNVHIKDCTQTFIKQLKNTIERNNNKYEIDHLEQRLYRWSMDVIVSIIFGTTFATNSLVRSALDDFSNIVHKIFETSAALMSFPPKLAQLLNLKIWSDFEDNVSNVLQKGHEIIDMCMNTANNDNGLYAKLRDADVPLIAIKRMFVDLAIAAGDTTAFSCAWALYLLSQGEDIQQQLMLEGKYLHVKGSPLAQGLIKETLRLYPVAPFIGRYAPHDVSIDGYQIKKDTLMLLSLYTAGRDGEHFPEPMRVMPERWIRNEVTDQYHAVHQPHATLPFAIGNRSCIGRKIALRQMEYLITEVTKTFHISCTNTTPIKPVLRLVTVPNQPLQLLFTIRNHL